LIPASAGLKKDQIKPEPHPTPEVTRVEGDKMNTMIDIELFLALAEVFPEALNSDLGKEILTRAQELGKEAGLAHIRKVKNT
jgi:hypothetical protein